MVIRTSLLFSLFAAAVCAQTPTVTSMVSQGGASAGLCPGVAATLSFNSSSPKIASTITIGGQPVTETAGGPSGGTSASFQIQVPWGLPSGTANVIVTQNGSASPAFPITLAQYCPAIVDAPGTSNYPFVDGNFMNINAFAAYPAVPGQPIFMGAVGLGPTTPLIPNGQLGVGATNVLPVVMVGSQQAQVFSAALFTESVDEVGSADTTKGESLGYAGLYQVVFNVPTGMADGAYPVVISVGGVSSAPQSLVVGTSGGSLPPANVSLPEIVAIENAANFHVYCITGYGTTQNTLVSVYATNLGSVVQLNGIYPATSYQGIQVMINYEPAPIYTIDGPANLINVALPPGQGFASGTAVPVQVVTPAGTSFFDYVLYEEPEQTDDIGVFRLSDGVSGVIQFSGTAWLVMSPTLASAYGAPACTGLAPAASCAQPAKAGDLITIYFTGGGLATPNGAPGGQPLALGQVAPADGNPVYQMVNTPAVTIGGIPAPVSFAGIVPSEASVYQINVTVPAGVPTGNAVPLVVTGQSSVDTVDIAIQ